MCTLSCHSIRNERMQRMSPNVHYLSERHYIESIYTCWDLMSCMELIWATYTTWTHIINRISVKPECGNFVALSPSRWRKMHPQIVIPLIPMTRSVQMIMGMIAWASCQIRKIAGAHAPGMPGTFPPSPQVGDPGMHHGTCVTHVPWCMPRSLTSSFLWNRRRAKPFPAFPAHAQPAILRIW